MKAEYIEYAKQQIGFRDREISLLKTQISAKQSQVSELESERDAAKAYQDQMNALKEKRKVARRLKTCPGKLETIEKSRTSIQSRFKRLLDHTSDVYQLLAALLPEKFENEPDLEPQPMLSEACKTDPAFAEFEKGFSPIDLDDFSKTDTSDDSVNDSGIQFIF